MPSLEDRRPVFPCECGGEICLTDEGFWECDNCSFKKKNKMKVSGNVTVVLSRKEKQKKSS